jgi:predicted acylesterase/phospholipase RssA
VEEERASFADVVKAEDLLIGCHHSRLGIKDDERWGLALSGGGIRSATFCLGVVEWLIRQRRISAFDYLSTVSGGGYIGSWLVGMLHRHGQGKDRSDIGSAPLDAAIHYLRRYSNYLTPRTGALKPDTLAALLIYVRNFLLNAALLIPVFASLLLLPALLSGLAVEISRPFSTALLAAGVPADGQRTLELARESPAWMMVTAACFLLQAVLAGLGGPRPAGRPQPWYMRERFLAPTMAVLGFLAFLLLAQFLMLVRPVHSGALDPRKVWEVVLYGMCNYCLLSLLALIVWSLAGRKQEKWNLDDRTGKRRFQAFAQYFLGTLIAGAVGGLLLALTYHYLVGWISGVLSLAGEPPAGQLQELLEEVRRIGYGHFLASMLLMPALVAIGFVTVSVHVAACRRGFTEHDREWGSRWLAYSGRLLILWLAACLLAFVVPPLFHSLDTSAVAGVATWLAASGLTAHFARSLGQPATGLSGKARGVLVAAGPYVFVIGLLCALSLLNHAVLEGLREAAILHDAALWWSRLPAAPFLDHMSVAAGAWNVSLVTLGGLTLASLFVSFLAGFAVDVNLFTLQNFYRNRLTRCYLGASRFASAETDECRRWEGIGGRRPHPPTDFDPDDDLRLARLSMVRPYPIINTALNLNVASELAWQQRKAASFVFSPLYCGYQIPLCYERWETTGAHGAPRRLWEYAAGGFRPTFRYLFPEDCGAKLGLPVAISGAAFTSNAGVHTRPWMTFLLTVFGIRLGRWCGNTGLRSVWRRPGPLNSLGLLFGEVLGLTTEKRRFVYLSDGGHFENLGLYELVRRECDFIVAIDASADPEHSFGDLASALRRCRIDFGVEITFADDELHALALDGKGVCRSHVAKGVIRYPGKEKPGRLLYVKASVTGDEPADVLSYRAQHALFPHETTLDQWFDEPQFESYRELGQHVASHALAARLPDRV